MKLICHIGTPKTASTFLQNSCEANPDWLYRHGIAYGRALAPDANHIPLAFAAATEIRNLTRAYGINTMEELVAFRAELVAEIARHRDAQPEGIDTMILSSENLTGNIHTVEEIANVKEMLAPLFDEIEIVIYVRRQDDAILSMYGERMRRGFPTGPFQQYLDNCLSPRCPVPYIYYRRELMKWIEVWGQAALTVRLFDREAFIGGQILTDFMAVVLGRLDFDMSDFVPSAADNRGLSAPVLEALRRLHPMIPFMKTTGPNQTRDALLPYINALPTEPRPTLSHRQATRILTHFEAANDWLRDSFFPDHDGPLFPARGNLPEESNIGQLSNEQFAEIGSLLLDPLLEDR